MQRSFEKWHLSIYLAKRARFQRKLSLFLRWVKKGSKSTLGYKGFARTDEEGFVDKVHTTPANQAESPQFEVMIEGAKAQRVLADKAYASKVNRASLRGKHRDGIMRKAARNRPLRASEKRFNRMTSKRRFRVE